MGKLLRRHHGRIAGVLYSALIVWRATHQTGYKMVAEDWVWHVGFAFLSYAALFVAGVTLRRNPRFRCS